VGTSACVAHGRSRAAARSRLRSAAVDSMFGPLRRQRLTADRAWFRVVRPGWDCCTSGHGLVDPDGLVCTWSIRPPVPRTAVSLLCSDACRGARSLRIEASANILPDRGYSYST
jgi:hypothetical protein